MHHGMGMGQGAQNGMARRLIFLRVDAVGGQTDPAALFGINLHRSPLFLADVEMHTLVVQEIRDLPADTGWRRGQNAEARPGRAPLPWAQEKVRMILRSGMGMTSRLPFASSL